MTIQEDWHEGFVILRLQGRLVAGDPAAALREHAEDLIARGVVRVAVDLAGLAGIDSTGMGSILMSTSVLRAAGGSAHWFQAPPRIRELLELTGLTKVLTLFADQNEAIRTFQGHRVAEPGAPAPTS